MTGCTQNIPSLMLRSRYLAYRADLRLISQMRDAGVLHYASQKLKKDVLHYAGHDNLHSLDSQPNSCWTGAFGSRSFIFILRFRVCALQSITKNVEKISLATLSVCPPVLLSNPLRLPRQGGFILKACNCKL